MTQVTQSPKRATLGAGIAMLLLSTLPTMALILLAPILPQLMHQFAREPGADFLVPMILTLPGLCVALTSPIAGYLGDRFGRRKLLIAALLVNGVVGCAPVFLRSLYPILASRLVVGLSEAVISTMSSTIIADLFSGPARRRWLAGQPAVASISAIVLLNVGGSLGTLGWHVPFWVYSSALVMMVVVAITTRAEERTEQAHAPAGDAPLMAFPWRAMAVPLVITFLGGILFFTLQIQPSRGFAALGMTNPARIGFFISIAAIGVPIGTLIYNRCAKLPTYLIFAAELLLLGVGLAVMGLARTPTEFAIGCAISQVGGGMLLPTLLVNATQHLDYAVRARGMGWWHSVLSLGQWSSPITITLLTRAQGSLFSAFLWLAGAAFAGAAVALFVPRRRWSRSASEPRR
jgi:MFS family permease